MCTFFLLWFGVLIRLFVTAEACVGDSRASGNSLLFWMSTAAATARLFDTLFRVIAYQFWSTWKEALIIVTPGTMVRLASTRFPFYGA